MREYSPPADFWPHQSNGFFRVVELIDGGARRIVVTAPCGAGKTRLMVALIEWAQSCMKTVAMYTVRRMLHRQTADVLERHGVNFGMRASGHELALLRDVQLCMTQSELAAVYRRKSRELHRADLVLIDEIHMQGGGTMRQIIQDHVGDGAVVIAFTATPLDLEGEWDELVIAGTNSELRACGAHVVAKHYCPDEPDLKHIKNYRVGDDLTDRQNAKLMMRPGVFGRVWDHWMRLNYDGKPTILFAPDVAGSIYFAEQFTNRGVRAAHIDAKQIWLDGELMPSNDDNRQMVLDGSESGEIVVLCNRFVLREGIDLPHIGHGILACVMGSLTTYLQACGRLIRSHHSLDEVCIQDHGGNYVRHGSVNSDRHWELGQSGYKTTGMRAERMREDQEKEPIRCPQCGAMRLWGPTCHECGHSHSHRSRIVVQIDGELREQTGPTFKKHRTAMKDDTQKLWDRYYHGARNKGRTFNQAAAWFFYNEHYWPPRELKGMPREPSDWFEKVNQVPRERLYA